MALRYHPRMPLIRCAKCGQAYDVPGVIAVRLPNSIATCACGEWLAGSKAALLARLGNPDAVVATFAKQGRGSGDDARPVFLDLSFRDLHSNAFSSGPDQTRIYIDVDDHQRA